MGRIIGRLALSFFLLFGLTFALSAEAKTKETKKKAKTRTSRSYKAPAAESSSTRYADLVIDAQTGRIIFGTNSTAVRHPASLTKMMTLYLTFQALESGRLRLDTPLPVSTEAARQSPTKLGLKAGQTVRVYDAIMGVITTSANDAAVVLAEALGGSVRNFAALMTQQAKALGMKQTVFQNPNGLPDPNQITSAQDMAVLGYALIHHFPGFYPYFSHNNFSYKGRVFNNHNNLMKRYAGMDGIKTGYIRASGFNLVSSAVRNDVRLIGVVFGGTSASSRDAKMEALLNKAFELEKTQSLAQARYLPLPSKTRSVLTAARGGLQSEGPEKEGGGWGIQVGAYSEVESAQIALASLARSASNLLANAEQSVQKITMADGSPMYRARFTGLSQEQARATCSHVIRHGRGCLVVTEP